MPVPTTLASLSTTAASNSPSGGENPFPDLDDHIRAGYAFDAQNRDAIATKLNSSAVSAFGLTLVDDADAATARATLGAVGTSGDQTIAGIKTFSSAPIVPTQTAGDNSTKAASTAYVVGAIADRPRMSLTAVQATTSGTTVEYTTVPSWAKRISVILRGVGTTGTSYLTIQIGSSTFTVSGYEGSVTGATFATNGSANFVASGFPIHRSEAAQRVAGVVEIFNQESNVWVASGALSIAGGTTPHGVTSSGSVSLGGVLDRIRITSVSGDTFTAGSIAYLFEG
jgi:hypothetical protein